jgi:hypothetical protein
MLAGMRLYKFFSQSEPPPSRAEGGLQINVGRYEVVSFFFSQTAGNTLSYSAAPKLLKSATFLTILSIHVEYIKMQVSRLYHLLELCTVHRYTVIPHRYTVIPVSFNTVRTGIFHNCLYGSPYGSMSAHLMWKHKENLRIL